jgi:hypothetical protein
VITSVKRDSKKALGFPPTARRSPAYLYDNLKIRLTDYVNCVKHKLQEIIFFDGLFSNRLLCTWLPPQPATSNQQPAATDALSSIRPVAAKPGHPLCEWASALKTDL